MNNTLTRRNALPIESWSTDCHIINYSGGSRFHGTYYYAKPNVKRPFG